MDSLLDNCCVGVIVNSECHKQHFMTNLSLLILREQEDEIQRVIKLRIECENISTICAHHYSIYFQYYDTPQFNFSKNCCDPFKKHKRVVRGSSKIDLKLSDSVFELKNDLRLIPGKNLCPRCYMQVTKIKNLEPQSARNEENDQLDFIDNGDVIPFSEEQIITPRRVISALSNASIITPVTDLNKSNTERRSQICVKVLDNLKRNILDVNHDPSMEDYLDLMEAVKEKINSTEDRSKKLSLLTLAPNSWTNRQTSEYFGVSEYCVAQARSNKEKYGILSDAPSEKNRKGQVTDADKQRMIEFYASDEHSRQLPGMNNLETILAERDDFIEKLVVLVNKLTTHHFVARNQSAYLVQSKENIDHETCVLVSDFSENFSFVIQDSVQCYYWSNDQATLLPFMAYMKKNCVECFDVYH
uniref:Uncharacterized protein n=1 Tax=Daphnia galeata TaxID=27404 RepID=A0A8J2W689_9CRUS|nr:unnamed protein product [Daphnia galeata]